MSTLRRFTTPNLQPVVQAAKAAIAAVAAWILASDVLSLPQPFLAPYAAVFLVESTLYRSAWLSVQQVGAVAIGVVLGWLAVTVVPQAAVAIGIATLVGLVIGRWRGFGSSGMWIGITALLVISYGTADQPVLLLHRLLETALGAALGLLVNAVVLPPIYLRDPQRATAELAEKLSQLLRGMASTLREERERDEQPDWTQYVRDAEPLVRQGEEALGWSTESALFNPRQRRRQRTVVREWQPALRAMRSAWPHLREVAEAVHDAASERALVGYPGEDARRALAGVFDDLADTILQLGQPGGSVDAARDALSRADETLQGLERDIIDDGRSDAPVGVANMLLPTAKATVELRL